MGTYCKGLAIGDLGYVQQSREEIEALFTLLAERYERGSMLISSNLPFSKWTRSNIPTLTDSAQRSPYSARFRYHREFSLSSVGGREVAPFPSAGHRCLGPPGPHLARRVKERWRLAVCWLRSGST